MAPQGSAVAVVFVLAAALTPGCGANSLSPPGLPSGGICCQLAGMMPSRLLKPGVSTFTDAQTLCSRTQPRPPFIFYTGDLGAAAFGCGTVSEPLCLQRDASACSVPCLRTRSCFLRYDNAKPFYVEQEVTRTRQTGSTAIIDTKDTRTNSETKAGDNGETIRNAVSEASQGRLNISSTEKQDSRFRGVGISSRTLSALGDAILRSGPSLRERPATRLGLITPSSSPRQPVSVFASGSGSASETGSDFCCRLGAGHVVDPLSGVTTLVESESRCRTRQLGYAVQINYNRWGCADTSFKTRCAELNTCDGCITDDSCMTVYRISLAISIQQSRNRLTGSNFAVGQVDRGRTSQQLATRFGRSSLTGLRTIDNLTVSGVSGTLETRRVSQENRRLSSEIGPAGASRGGVTVEGAVSITEAARTNSTTQQQISDRDRRALNTDLTRAGQQEGFRRQTVDKDVQQDRDVVVRRDERSREVQLTASSTGDQRAELLPGLRSPRDGSASLTAGDRNISQVGQESVFKSTVERTDDNTNLRTAAGDRTRSSASTAALRSEAERTGARNDSNIRTTAFATNDRELGQVELAKTEINSGSVVNRARVDAERAGGSSRTVTACARCNSTSDLTERSRSNREGRATDHIETVQEDVTTRTRVAPGAALPVLSVMAQNVKTAQTVDSTKRGSGTTHTASLLNTTAPGVRTTRDRAVLTVDRTNSTDHTQEVTKVQEVRTVRY